MGQNGKTSHVAEQKWDKIPVPTTVLYGEYDLNLDDKNRLSIPAEVRHSIDPERDGEAFYLVVGINQRPWLYPERIYENLVANLASEMAPGDDLLAFDQMNFAMASKFGWDKQGRILLPEKNLKRTSLGREITMIGARDHLELWNRAEWATYSEQLIARRAEISLRAKQAKPASS